MYISLELILSDDILTTGVTYTQHVPVILLPSCDVAVTLHLPVPTANISPDSSTTATDSLDDFHVTSLIVASSGVITAVALTESPIRSLTVSGSTYKPVTGLITLTMQEALTPLPSTAVAVITALPTPLALILPSWST